VSEARLVWKQDIRILPLWTVVLFLYYLDRANLSHAVLLRSDGADNDDIVSDTGMTPRQYKTAQTVFFLASILFAVPSNILLKRMGPSRWIALTMFAWGVVSMCMSVADGAAAAGVRFLQGAFQAGILPGLPFHLTFWYRARERGVRLALALAVAVLASSFGPAIAQATVDNLRREGGIAAWRWLFIAEGAPACVVALVVLFALPDFPEAASWLSNDEKEFAMRRLYVEGSKRYEKAASRDHTIHTLLDFRLYGHYLAFLGISCALASLPLFAPAINSGRGFAGMQAQLMAVPPFAVAAAVGVVAGATADRFNSRALHAAVLATVGAIGFLASAIVAGDAYGARYACLFLATAGPFACLPLLLGWLADNVADAPAVGLALALNAGLGGGLGDMVATWSYKDDEAARGFPTGHWVNAVLLLSVAAVCILLRLHYHERNHRVRMETGGHGAIRFFCY